MHTILSTLKSHSVSLNPQRCWKWLTERHDVHQAHDDFPHRTWLVVEPPLCKYESHLGWLHFHSIWENKKVMFQSPPFSLYYPNTNLRNSMYFQMVPGSPSTGCPTVPMDTCDGTCKEISWEHWFFKWGCSSAMFEYRRASNEHRRFILGSGGLTVGNQSNENENSWRGPDLYIAGT